MGLLRLYGSKKLSQKYVIVVKPVDSLAIVIIIISDVNKCN